MTNKTKVTATTPQPSGLRLKRWTGPRPALVPASSSSLRALRRRQSLCHSLLSPWVIPHTGELKNGFLLPCCVKADANPVTKAGSHKLGRTHACKAQCKAQRAAKAWEQQGWGAQLDSPRTCQTPELSSQGHRGVLRSFSRGAQGRGGVPIPGSAE